MNILIRADSSYLIGTGHVMRDLVLTKQFKDSNIVFATQNLKGNINYKIKEAGFKIELLENNNIDNLDNLIKKLNIELLVIDHYEIDYEYEKLLKKENPNVTIMVLADIYEKHYCDILLNHNISAEKRRYKEFLPKHCEIRCGFKYSLLREEFFKEKKKKRKEKKKRKTVLISMGGSDNNNINIKILESIKSFKNINVNIVTTKANKNLDKLKMYCNRKKWINLYINTNEIAKIMNNSCIAIITPSVTLNEVYFMKLPFIAIKTAENQIENCNYLKKKNFFVMDNFNKQLLKLFLIKSKINKV